MGGSGDGSGLSGSCLGVGLNEPRKSTESSSLDECREGVEAII